MTAAPVLIRSELDAPRIYIACPLTNLSGDQMRGLSSEIILIKSTIERVCFGDRVADEAWPVAVYAPFDHTGPWKNDGLSGGAVYESNLTELLDSDALIVLADRAASAGVGQELEWAARAGLPILYLSSSTAVSRQILGTPADITCVPYGNDAQTLEARVADFLARRRGVICDGPRRRTSRRLRYEVLTAQLRGAWQQSTDPTGVTARCNVHPNLIHLVLVDPARVALLPVDTLDRLCAELEVERPTRLQLSIASMRALLAAAAEEGWSDEETEVVRIRGLAALGRGRADEPTTITAWRALGVD